MAASADDSAAKSLARKQCGVCADDMDAFRAMQRSMRAATAAPAVAASAAAALPSPLPCPPTSESLGRASWTFLHTTAAYYPDSPTPTQQLAMKSLIRNVAAFYPCPPCAEHFQAHVVANPPATASRSALSQFLCRYHNDVNVRLRKPVFDCTRYDERWRDGPKEDAGYDCVEEP